MKKIRFFITSLDCGGAEKVLINLLQRLDPEQYQISVLSLIGGQLSDSIPNYVSQKRICRKGFFHKVLMKLPRALFAGIFLRGDYDYEVAYLEGWPTEVVSYKKGRSKKVAFVHCDISIDNPLRRMYPHNDQCRKIYNRFDKVCFVSEDCKKGFFSEFGELTNSCVVHNVQNYAEISEKANETCEEYKTNGLKLLSVGRISAEKGIVRLIRAVELLEKKYDFELIIVGDGPEKVKIEEYIEANQIKSVRLIGFKSNPYPFFKKADLLVCSSFYEGFSTVCNEAVFLGLPVLTTDCSGMNEILHSGDFGFIVDNSEKGLVDGLNMVLSEPAILYEKKKAIICSNSLINGLCDYIDLFDGKE